MWERRPLSEAAADPETDPEVAHRLGLVAAVRDFARGLGLDVGDQYTYYVPWPGDRIATSVVATRPSEVEPAGFDFPFVGHLPYKGFFDPARAEAEAERLRAEGLDVCMVPVSAYSTLGWLDDPVTGPMARRAQSDGEFVETLLHELVHVTAFWPEDPDFSESIAAFVGQEAVIRFAAVGAPTSGFRGSAAGEWQRVYEARAVGASLLRFRSRVASLYAELLESADVPGDASRARRRAALETAARKELAALPLGRLDAGKLSEHAKLGDACLAIRGTYAADGPAHAALFDRMAGDLDGFIERMQSLDEDLPRAAFFASP